MEEMRSMTNYHPPDRIFSVDESGFTTCQSKISKKRVHNRWVLSPQQKDNNKAPSSFLWPLVETYVLLLLLFQRKRVKMELQD